jgi:hypothetical protein
LLLCSIPKLWAQGCDGPYHFFDEKLQMKLENFKYDRDAEEIIFELQLKKGDGYPSTINGPAANLNIRYDIILEPGVELANLGAGVNYGILSTNDCLVDWFEVSYLDGALSVSMTRTTYDFTQLPSLVLHPDFYTKDFGDEFVTIGTVAIPVISETKPTSLTHFDPRQMEYEPHNQSSYWTTPFSPCAINGNDGGGFGPDIEFHLMPVIEYFEGEGLAGSCEFLYPDSLLYLPYETANYKLEKGDCLEHPLNKTFKCWLDTLTNECLKAEDIIPIVDRDYVFVAQYNDFDDDCPQIIITHKEVKTEISDEEDGGTPE